MMPSVVPSLVPYVVASVAFSSEKSYVMDLLNIH